MAAGDLPASPSPAHGCRRTSRSRNLRRISPRRGRAKRRAIRRAVGGSAAFGFLTGSSIDFALLLGGARPDDKACIGAPSWTILVFATEQGPVSQEIPLGPPQAGLAQLN